MTVLVQIRGVSEETRRALKARAALQGQSLNSYLLELLDRDIAQPTVAEVLQRVARRAEVPSESVVDMLDAIRGEREAHLLSVLDRSGLDPSGPDR